eukprot:271340_1
MSHRVKAWLSSIRRTHSSSSFDENESDYSTDSPFETVASDVIQYILSFLDSKELHSIRLIGKEWNNLCDIEQKILSLNIKTPCSHIKYWMLKLRNIHHVNLSHNHNIDNQFLIWLKKEYFPLKIKQKQRQKLSISSLSSISSNESNNNINIMEYNIQLNIHIDISFCSGIDCVEEPQLFGRGAVNGHNDYLKKLINTYQPYGCTFNIFGNFRIINPSITLNPKHLILLSLHALKYDEIQHCFKFASPANRQFTGPLPRFERMIKNGYPIMIHWDCIELNEWYNDTNNGNNNQIINVLQWEGSEELQKHFIVGISKNGNKSQFKWTLSKQKLEPYYQCWMTDSVCSFYSQ